MHVNVGNFLFLFFLFEVRVVFLFLYVHVSARETDGSPRKDVMGAINPAPFVSFLSISVFTLYSFFFAISFIEMSGETAKHLAEVCRSPFLWFVAQ